MAGTLVSVMSGGTPAYIASSLTNIFTPAAAPIALNLRHIHIYNTTASSCYFSLFIGATGAGVQSTALFYLYPVAAFTPFDYWCDRKLVSTNFLVGIAQTASSLTIDVEGYQYVVG